MRTPRLLGLCIAIACSALAGDPAHTLWYPEPGREVMTEGLPIGNGRLGALVLGGVSEETIVLNEGTLWQGGPYDPNHDEAWPALAEVRRLLNEGKFKEAEQITEDKLMGRPKFQAAYSVLGTLTLQALQPATATDYRRELDLKKGELRITYRVGDVDYERTYLASVPDNVIAIRIKASKPGQISFVAKVNTPQPNTIHGADLGGLSFWGGNMESPAGPGKLRYFARVRVHAEGGRATPGEQLLTVRNADSVTLYVAAATSYVNWQDVSGNPSKKVNETLGAVEKKTFETVQEAHRKNYGELYGRFTMNLGPTADESLLPTDVRIDRFRNGRDLALASLYVHFARYLLLSSSRAGGQPATLQGLWNDKIHPPWGSKYTININTEMNYWPAEPANLAECVEPLFAMVEDLSVSGQRTAQRHYRARGWVAHHNTDLWRATAPVDGAPWGMWPTGGAWLLHNLWEQYEYSRDPSLLKRLYPLLKGASLFFLDTLVPDPKNGWLVTSPTLSPENRHPGGVAIAAGTTMDSEIIRDLFNHTVDAGEVLGLDPEFLTQVKAARAKLPPLRIGKGGQLMEWMEDWDLEAPEQNHRHVSHLYALFPSDRISPQTTPDLAKAARVTLERRGDISTGWSLAWKINFWARLQDGERAYQLLSLLLAPQRSYTNLFDAHPPFQIDGNFGGASGIIEMVVQSQRGEVHLLPALPKAWVTGEMKGVRVRGGATLDLAWDNGRLTKALATAEQDVTLRVRVAGGATVREVIVKAGVPTSLLAP